MQEKDSKSEQLVNIINELRNENEQLRGEIDEKNEQIGNLKSSTGQLQGENMTL